jgi:undecaprenyl-diphosphatase
MSKKPVATRVGQALTHADAQVHEAVKPVQQSTPVRLIGMASEIGDQPQLRILSATLIAGGLLTSNDRLVKAGARMLVAHELTTAVKNQIKNRVDRTRPRSAETDEDREVRPGHSTDKEETSFPSGHSAGAIAAARAFSREYPEYAAQALGAAGLVALAQIPRCAHYPTDVASGLAVGAMVEEGVHSVWTRIEDRLRADQPREPAPAELEALEANAELAI